MTQYTYTKVFNGGGVGLDTFLVHVRADFGDGAMATCYSEAYAKKLVNALYALDALERDVASRLRER